MTDLGNQQHVQQRNKALKKRAAREGEGLKKLVADEQGRAYLAHLVRESKLFEFAVVAPASEHAMYREGLRTMGQKVLGDVEKHAPEHLPALIKSVLAPIEDKEDDRSDDQ